MSDHRRTSVAVMARRVEPADSLDYFPTPPWATRAFCEHVLPIASPWPDRFRGGVWDPACGEGHMALALDDYFDVVEQSDIHDYGFGPVSDFLHPEPVFAPQVGWIVTNPPFNRAVDFARTALLLAGRGAAMLVRTQWLEGEGRYDALFSRRPPQIVAQFVERVPMHKGRWVVNGSTATAYCWVVWLVSPPHDWRSTRYVWIPKSRRALSRPDDWLRFHGSSDLPKDHAVRRLLEGAAEPARPASIADIRREMERLL